MKILITIGHLEDFAGSELFTTNLTQELASRGHIVTIYSPILGKIAESIDGLGNVELTNDLEKVKKTKFDVIHIQHNITAWAVRKYFPNIPAVMIIHGILPKMEQPPKINLGVHKYIVVSNGVRDHLIDNHNIPRDKIEVLNNWVNTKRFFKKNEINKKPEKLLVLSNHLDSRQEKIYRKVCEDRGIEFMHVGLPENPVRNVEDYINKVDIVVTVGRGAMEAMACGRNVIVSDINGIDGMITPENYKELVKNNFSGHRYHRELTEEIFRKELNKYSKKNSKDLVRLIEKFHSPQNAVKSLLKFYKEARKEKVHVDPLYKIPLLEIDILLEKLKDNNYQIRHLESELKNNE